MLDGVSWEEMAAVIVVSALAAASLTEVVKKAIQQGIIERTGDKPWWRGTILRITSVVAGAGFGWLSLPSNPRLGLILGIGSGSVTAEVVGMVQRHEDDQQTAQCIDREKARDLVAYAGRVLACVVLDHSAMLHVVGLW